MDNDELTQQPHIVHSHDIHIDTAYAEWIADLKYRYRSEASLQLGVRS